MLFILRDAITIFGSFALPPLLAPKLAGIIENQASRLKAAQFALPVAAQFVTTPIHLLGLDMHNSRERLCLLPRWSRIQRDLGSAVPARMLRVILAFGVGGVVNTATRQSLIELVDSKRNRQVFVIRGKLEASVKQRKGSATDCGGEKVADDEVDFKAVPGSLKYRTACVDSCLVTTAFKCRILLYQMPKAVQS